MSMPRSYRPKLAPASSATACCIREALRYHGAVRPPRYGISMQSFRRFGRARRSPVASRSECVLNGAPAAVPFDRDIDILIHISSVLPRREQTLGFSGAETCMEGRVYRLHTRTRSRPGMFVGSVEVRSLQRCCWKFSTAWRVSEAHA